MKCCQTYGHNEKSAKGGIHHLCGIVVPKDEHKACHTEHQAHNKDDVHAFGEVKLRIAIKVKYKCLKTKQEQTAV